MGIGGMSGKTFGLLWTISQRFDTKSLLTSNALRYNASFATPHLAAEQINRKVKVGTVMWVVFS